MFTTIKNHHLLFSAYAARQIEAAREEGCFSRSENYRTAIQSFTRAVGEVPLRKVSASEVARHQQYMHRRGICQNTVSCYNRTLRAIYNKAVKEGLVKDRKPFADCFTGRMNTDKRSVPPEYICRLKRLDLRGKPTLERARDYFLFSFYAMGMPFVDVACLHSRQIHGDTLLYYRHKTDAPVHVPLSAEACRIIRKYANPRSPYVFPVLHATVPAEAYREYCSSLGRYNRSLKALARRAAIPVNLTSYTVRHSWASLAYQADVPIGVIAQALGHSHPDITMTYIRELDNDTLRRGNERVLRLLEE